jgi:hypothetical protein
VFAPFGRWEKAQDGVAHYMPVKEFEFKKGFNSAHFNAKGEALDAA